MLWSFVSESKRATIHCNSLYENIGEMNKQLKFVESSYNPEAV